MRQHRLEVADVVHAHQKEFLQRWGPVVSRQQRKALRDIGLCRTAALGAHLQQCNACSYQTVAYLSCRNLRAIDGISPRASQSYSRGREIPWQRLSCTHRPAWRNYRSAAEALPGGPGVPTSFCTVTRLFLRDGPFASA
ncbi:MAG: transposase zinc-binding domain-containing protein [Candidatus Korobacteraceae bacterium]